jgi:hypothetical protein
MAQKTNFSVKNKVHGRNKTQTIHCKLNKGRKVNQLKGKKLALFLGTAKICQLVYSASKMSQ